MSGGAIGCRLKVIAALETTYDPTLRMGPGNVNDSLGHENEIVFTQTQAAHRRQVMGIETSTYQHEFRLALVGRSFDRRTEFVAILVWGCGHFQWHINGLT